MLAQMLPLLALQDRSETFLTFFFLGKYFVPSPSQALPPTQGSLQPEKSDVFPIAAGLRSLGSKRSFQHFFLGGVFFTSLLEASPKNNPFYIFVITLEKKCAIIPEWKEGGRGGNHIPSNLITLL